MTINWPAAIAIINGWADEKASLLKVTPGVHFYAGIATEGRSEEECAQLARRMKVELMMVLGNDIRFSYKTFDTLNDLEDAIQENSAWLEEQLAKMGV